MNGGFTLKIHQMFSVHTTPEKFENTTITVHHFGFVFEGNPVREITTPFCSKSYVFKMFCVHTEVQSRCFQIRNRNRKNKAAFSKFSDKVWTGPKNISLGGYNCVS